MSTLNSLVLSLFLVTAPVLCTAQQQPPAAPETVAPDRLDELVESRTPTLIGEGFKFTEGPLWNPATGKLVFSDISGQAIYAAAPGETPFTPETAEVVLKPGKGGNGNAFDGEGRIVNAGYDRGVVRIVDGKTVEVASAFEGKRLNSPNDVVVKSDGAIYFTDPPFFAPRDGREIDFSGVYRVGPDGAMTLLTKQFQLPNGLAFSKDEKKLYINEHGKREVWAFDVAANGSIENGKLLIAMKGEEGQRGSADGLKVDAAGNIWTTGPGGVWAISPEGEKLGVIAVRGASNVAFGGPDRKTLFITAGGSLYQVRTKVAGL